MYLSVRIKTNWSSQIYLNTWPECQATSGFATSPLVSTIQLEDATLQYISLAPCCQIYRVTEEA